MSELTILHAKAKFFEATKEERRIQQEHKRLLLEHINDAIERGKRTALYAVPLTLSPLYDDYDVNEIALWLIRTARRGGFEVELVSPDPPLLRFSGWNDAAWLDADQPRQKQPTTRRKQTTVKRATTTTLPPRHSVPVPKRAPPSSTLSGEDASRLAQSGAISQRLRAAAARYSGGGAGGAGAQHRR